MRHDLIISHLLAMRSTVEALIAEVEEDRERIAPKCCDAPKLITMETYLGAEVRCHNCDTVLSASSGAAEGGHVNGSRQT